MLLIQLVEFFATEILQAGNSSSIKNKSQVSTANIPSEVNNGDRS